MPRANRYFVPGYAYHLSRRCHDRQFLLRLVQDRGRYRMLLREAVQEFGVSLLDFCVTSASITTCDAEGLWNQPPG